MRKVISDPEGMGKLFDKIFDAEYLLDILAYSSNGKVTMVAMEKWDLCIIQF